MNRHTQSIIILYTVILVFLNACPASPSTSGNNRGNANIDPCVDVYSTPQKDGNIHLIGNWRQIVAIGSADTQSYPDGLPLDGHYKLSADIAFPGTSCPNILSQVTIIGGKDRPFVGVFDGNGKTLSGLSIQKNSSDFVGLFSVLGDATNTAEVKNLKFNNLQITANAVVGAVTGWLVNGSITSVLVTGTSSIDSLGQYTDGLNKLGGYVGGLAGISEKDTTIIGASDASITATKNHVGGIVGYTEGTVIGFMTGSIASSQNNTGGLIGWAGPHASVTGYSSGTIAGNKYTGGLIGLMNNSSIANSTLKGYMVGSLIGTTLVGGLVGEGATTHTTTASTITGYTKAKKISGNTYTGGLVGELKGHVKLIGYSRSPVHRLPVDSNAQPSFGRIIGGELKTESTKTPTIKAQYSEDESTIFDDKENKSFDASDKSTAGISKLDTELIAELKTDLWEKRDTSKWPALVFSSELSALDGSQATADTQPIAE